MKLSQFSRPQWTAVAIAAGLLIAFAIGGISALEERASPGWTSAWTLSFGIGIVVMVTIGSFGMLFTKLAAIQEIIFEESRQARALANMRPNLGRIPVNFDGWSIDPLFGETLVRLIVTRKPKLILECGSGSSTLIAAACVRENGGGKVVSLEHDPEYAEQTRKLLEAYGLGDYALVVVAPLEDQGLNEKTVNWYHFDPGEHLPGKIDLLVVDGPPAGLAWKNADPPRRYPAVPLLRAHLASDCVILVDDGDREGEQRMVARWAEEIKAQLNYVKGGKGAWILEKLHTAHM